MSSFQCVSIEDDSENPIYCPFCGIKVLASAAEMESTEWKVGECEHLLFVGTSEGFDHRSSFFDTAVETAFAELSEEEREELEHDVLGICEIIQIRNAFMFEQQVGPPAGFSAYVGFRSLV